MGRVVWRNVQNWLDLTLPPEELFLNPASDAGFLPLAEPQPFWRPHPGGHIRGFAASEHPEIAARIEGHLAHTRRERAFRGAAVFATLPVLMLGAQFKKSFVTVGGKGVLSGASGMRLMNRYLWANEDRGFDPDARLAAWFARCRDSAPKRLFPGHGTAEPGLPFAVECRNTFNYFHFLTESLCQLCTLDEIGADRPIALHFPNQTDKTRGFVGALVKALFPELAARVGFTRAPVAYDRVLGAHNLTHGYFLYPDQLVPPIDTLLPPGSSWQGRHASHAAMGILTQNAVDENLLRLRDRGLAAIAGKDFSHLPRRVWITRLDGESRPRALRGEGELFEMLSLFGFQRVAFETLSIPEQIALMANAEVMISSHGAGFANMLFAGPQTHVIELGTLQTAQYRWGDFWRLANAAMCHYTAFFADFDRPDPRTEPVFADEGIVPVALSRQGLAEVMSFVVTLLGHVPRLTRAADILRLARQLNEVGASARCLDLFTAHPGVEEGHAPLCLALAECHRQRGDLAAEIAALRRAHSADPGRAMTLMQVVWRAQRLDDRATMSWALERLGTLFPDRHAEMLRQSPWMARLA